MRALVLGAAGAGKLSVLKCLRVARDARTRLDFKLAKTIVVSAIPAIGTCA
jgi:hypothetical protein